MAKSSLRVWRCVLSASLLATANASASEFFKYEIIAQSGEAGIAEIMKGSSIDDQGKVVFGAGTQSPFDPPKPNQGIFIGDGTLPPVNITTDFTSDDNGFLSGVKINDRIFDQRVVALRIDEQTNITHVEVWRTDIENSKAIVASAHPTIPSPSQGVMLGVMGNIASINNSNDVAFSVRDNTVGTTGSIKTPVSLPGSYFSLTASANVEPVIADDGRVLFRTGDPLDSTAGDIRLYPRDLSGVGELVAEAGPMAFTKLGLVPGMSDDGTIVVFVGDLSEPGAEGLNAANQSIAYSVDSDLGSANFAELHSGPGVFAAVKTQSGQRAFG